MNKEAMTFKVEEYTITIHRGPEESKEMEQKRMAMYATWIFNMSMKPMENTLKNITMNYNLKYVIF